MSNVNIKLFLNIHKPGAPRNGGASPDYLTSGVHIDAFAVNGKEEMAFGSTKFHQSRMCDCRSLTST